MTTSWISIYSLIYILGSREGAGLEGQELGFSQLLTTYVTILTMLRH